jgi:AcrR family transcriptional regulator
MARSGRSVRRIIDAAADEFSARGYHLVVMDDIARRAGVAKGTAVVAEGMESLIREVEAAIETDEPVFDQVRTIIRIHVETFAEHPQILRIMVNELSGGLDPEIREYVRDMRARYHRFFAGVVSLGASEGLVRDLDHELMTKVLIDVVFSAASYLADHRDTISEDDICHFVSTLLFSGLFTRRGE